MRRKKFICKLDRTKRRERMEIVKIMAAAFLLIFSIFMIGVLGK